MLELDRPECGVTASWMAEDTIVGSADRGPGPLHPSKVIGKVIDTMPATVRMAAFEEYRRTYTTHHVAQEIV